MAVAKKKQMKALAKSFDEFKAAVYKYMEEQRKHYQGLDDEMESLRKDRDQCRASLDSVIRDKNWALGRPATQSSNYDSGHSSAAKAVDGNMSGRWGDASCACTKHQLNPWWSVDLGDVVPVGRVVIKNRADCCGERLRNFYIDVRETASSEWKTVATHPEKSHNGETITIELTEQVLASMLRIQIHATEFLTICEVKVFSK